MMPSGRRGLALLPLLPLLATFACEAPLHGNEYDPVSPAPTLELTAAAGTFRLSDLRDTTVLLYFGYTHCPDVCPTTLTDWAKARRILGDRAAAVRFVFVSVDPARDTPLLARAYARQFDSTFVGVVANEEQLTRLTRDWGVAVFTQGDPRRDDYGIGHPSRTYVIDRRGRLRLNHSPGTTPEQIADDVRRLR